MKMPKNYVVYAWLPVNVRVRARSEKEARQLAIDALSGPGFAFDLSEEDNGGLWLDTGVRARVDKEGPVLSDTVDGPLANTCEVAEPAE